MGLLSDRPVLIRVVAVEIPVPDRLDSPRRAYQRLETPAIFGGQFLRCIQQLFNSPQNDIFGFVEDVISFSGQLHVFTPFRLLLCPPNSSERPGSCAGPLCRCQLLLGDHTVDVRPGQCREHRPLVLWHAKVQDQIRHTRFRFLSPLRPCQP